MKKLLVFCVFGWSMYSCETIIDVDLNTADPKTTVDAAICPQDAQNMIVLTSSGRFQDAEGLEGIGSANILLDDRNGQTATFSEIVLGFYGLSGYTFNPGFTYDLTIQNGDETITASSTMPELVEIDSLYFEESFFPTPDGEEQEYMIHLVFEDPAEIENYYRVMVTVNDTLQDRKSVTSDEFTNGNVRDYLFFGENIHLGDSVQIELWSINREAYDFYTTLDDVLSSGFGSSTPYNPITNLSSGLGHFTIYQRSEKNARVAL
ncbi:MAG: DUF4249 domain-containing protein [Flavobacteriales bacterium]